VRLDSVDCETISDQPRQYAWFVCFVLALTYTVCAIDRFLMAIAVVPIKRAMAFSDTQLGMLTGLGFALLYCLSGVYFGRLADRVNRRNMIAIGILSWSVATAACSFADGFAGLFTARAAVGLGEATLIPAAMSLLAAYFPRASMGKAVGTFQVGVPFGKAIAFIGGGALLAQLTIAGGWTSLSRTFAPWQILFLAAAVPGLLASVLVLAIREPERVDACLARPSLRAASRFALDRLDLFGFHTIAWAASLLLQNVHAAWIPSFFVRRHGMGIGSAALLVGVLGLIGGASGALLGGAVMDRLQRIGSTRSAGLTFAISQALAVPAGVLLLFSTTVVWSAIGYFVFVLIVTMGAPAGPAGIQLMTPERFRGTMTAGLFALTSLVALGIGPVLVGMLTDGIFAGHGQNALGASIFAVCLLCAVIGTPAGLLARTRSDNRTRIVPVEP